MPACLFCDQECGTWKRLEAHLGRFHSCWPRANGHGETYLPEGCLKRESHFLVQCFCGESFLAVPVRWKYCEKPMRRLHQHLAVPVRWKYCEKPMRRLHQHLAKTNGLRTCLLQKALLGEKANG